VIPVKGKDQKIGVIWIRASGWEMNKTPNREYQVIVNQLQRVKKDGNTCTDDRDLNQIV
jgi:rhamnose utilization protein RhaD (predicted bifunctional aldolase and dehydrogenase)